MNAQIQAVKQGDVITTDGNVYEVQAKCESKHDGHWYCVTHDKHFGNQLQKDSHTHTGEHTLAWFCNEHGAFEVP